MATLSPDTRKRILDEAGRLFAEKKYGDIGMEMVAAAAGVGKVTVYRYFDSKERLLLGVLERIEKDYLGQVRAEDAKVKTKPCRDRLVAIVQLSLDYFYERRHVLRLIDRAGVEIDGGASAWPDVEREVFTMLEKMLAVGMAKGEFSVDHMELAVRALVGTMRSQIASPCVEIAREDFPSKLVGMVIRPVSEARAKPAA